MLPFAQVFRRGRWLRVQTAVGGWPCPPSWSFGHWPLRRNLAAGIVLPGAPRLRLRWPARQERLRLLASSDAPRTPSWSSAPSSSTTSPCSASPPPKASAAVASSPPSPVRVRSSRPAHRHQARRRPRLREGERQSALSLGQARAHRQDPDRVLRRRHRQVGQHRDAHVDGGRRPRPQRRLGLGQDRRRPPGHHRRPARHDRRSSSTSPTPTTARPPARHRPGRCRDRGPHAPAVRGPRPRSPRSASCSTRTAGARYILQQEAPSRAEVKGLGPVFESSNTGYPRS